MKLVRRLLPFVAALTCAACDLPFQSGANDPTSATSDDTTTTSSAPPIESNITTTTHPSGAQSVILQDGTVTTAIPLGSDMSGPQLVQPLNGDPPQLGTPLN